MKPLTEKQRTILEFVDRASRQQGFPPTLREIGQAVGLPNISAVRGHIEALAKKGYITKEAEKARSIRVLHGPSLLSRFKRKLHEFARTDEGVIHDVTYGLALATRHRRPALGGPCRAKLEEALDRRCAEHGWGFLERRVHPDHLVLVVQVWPNHSPELVVRRIRATLEGVLRRCGRLSAGQFIWARGYVATTDLSELEQLVEEFLQKA